VVGAGPGGAVLALLLARQGVDVALLEARTDFERDFRGDVVHPSTLELMDSLDLIDQVLQIPHAPTGPMPMHTRNGLAPLGAMPRLRSKYPQSLQLSQARLIELLVREATRYASFHLVLGARVEALLERNGRVAGVQYRTDSRVHVVECDLVVGADGRFSKVRQLAGIEAVGNAQPIDYVWFRLPRLESDPPDVDSPSWKRRHHPYQGQFSADFTSQLGCDSRCQRRSNRFVHGTSIRSIFPPLDVPDARAPLEIPPSHRY
jgi:2-polyprenyl-6-methoxyphenol hydroxylase-like FAD-dependent oxidoreductase